MYEECYCREVYCNNVFTITAILQSFIVLTKLSFMWGKRGSDENMNEILNRQFDAQ